MQLSAAQGYRNLMAGIRYHFLYSDQSRDRVILVYFPDADSSEKVNPSLEFIPREQFETGLVGLYILPCDTQYLFPHWLQKITNVENFNFQKFDNDRPSAKVSLFDRTSGRLQRIQPILNDFKNIMESNLPDKKIAEIARKSSPPQNENRLRRWFYTYIAFGRNFWTLVPDYSGIGKWDRNQQSNADGALPMKRGRPSIRLGKENGFNANLIVESIRLGYIKHKGLGVSMRSIYSSAMSDTFGCKVRTKADRQKEYYQPDGLPFPTLAQFIYHSKKIFGLDAIRTSKYGDQRYRETKFESMGPFTSNVGFLKERVESDGYFLSERPRGLIEGSVLPPLCVVRAIDAVSGEVAGIGFALGGESAAAYDMMMFSMAVNKVKYCSLFGVVISPHEWPGMGLSPNNLFDRGPAAASGYDAKKSDDEIFHIKGLAPSYQPMSKALVEASHPRQSQTGGKPTFVASDFSPFTLVRREIHQALLDNITSSVASRMTPEMLSSGTPCNPLGIHEYLEKRARTMAQPIEFSDAVRKFLTKKKFILKNDGLYLHTMRFDSPKLRSSGIFDKVNTSQAVQVDGYILDLAVRHAWVEVDNCLIEVDAQLPIRDNEDQLYLSISELEELASLKNSAEADQLKHRLAAVSEGEEKFKKETGKNWKSGTIRHAGTIKNTSISSLETKDIQMYTSKSNSK